MFWKHMVIPFAISTGLTVSGCAALAGETSAVGLNRDSFPFFELLQIGGPWIFLAWLINYHRDRDKREEVERKSRNELQNRLVTVVQDATVAMQIQSVSANELRASFDSLRRSIDDLREALYTQLGVRSKNTRTHSSESDGG